jgi:ketosteroid isomerase-like protein
MPVTDKEQGVPGEKTEIQMLEAEIQDMIDRETAAWDARDAEALVDLFHPDMIWPWPPDADSHDPASWHFPWGRYNRERWRGEWQVLFDTHTLVHNRRKTVKITLSAEGDGAFAVVDVDTLWRDRAGRDNHWLGRAGKGYTRVGGEWKLIMHTGLLQYAGAGELSSMQEDTSP